MHGSSQMQIAGLDATGAQRESAVMNRALTLTTLVAAAALAGCDTAPETVSGGPADPQANQIANEVANVQLPPAIVASHKYRCGDNSILAIDWLSDGTTNSARVTPKGGTVVALTQAAAAPAVEGDNAVAAQPAAAADYTAEGATLIGDPQAASVTFNGKTCKR